MSHQGKKLCKFNKVHLPVVKHTQRQADKCFFQQKFSCSETSFEAQMAKLCEKYKLSGLYITPVSLDYHLFFFPCGSAEHFIPHTSSVDFLPSSPGYSSDQIFRHLGRRIFSISYNLDNLRNLISWWSTCLSQQDYWNK